MVHNHLEWRGAGQLLNGDAGMLRHVQNFVVNRFNQLPCVKVMAEGHSGIPGVINGDGQGVAQVPHDVE